MSISNDRRAELRALPVDEREALRDQLRDELARLDKFERPTKAQIERSEELLAEFDELERSFKADLIRSAVADAKAGRTDRGVRVTNGFGGVNVNVRRDPFENVTALRHARVDDPDVIARAVTALSNSRSMYVDDSAIENAVRTVERVPGAAIHALVHGSPAYRSAFEAYLRSGGLNPMYTDEEVAAVRASMSLTGANGGFMLPTILDPSLIHTGSAVRDPIRNIARVVQGTQNVWHGVSVGNVTTYWTPESSALADGSPTFASPSVTASKLTAYVTASYEIFEDSNSLAQLPGVIAESMSFAEQTTFISGSGSGAPKGIVTAVSGTAGSTVTCTTRGSFTSASSADVYAVVNAVAPRYEDNTTWVGNKATFNVINQMSPNGGGSLYWGDLNGSAVTRPPLLGSPTVACSDMTASTTSGSKLLILGDFSQYVIFDRLGVMVEFVPQVFDTNGAPLGQRGLIAHKRVGADVTDLNAFRILNA